MNELAKPGEEQIRKTGQALRAWSTAVFLTFCYILSLLDRYIISFVAPAIKRDLGLSDLELGLVQGFAFSIIFAVAGLPLGVAVDRYHRTRLIAGAVAVWSVMTALCGVVSNFLGLMLARIGVGAGEAGLTPAAYSIFGDLFPRHQLPLAFTLYQFGPSLATACAAWISGTVLLAAGQDGILVLPYLGPVQAWRVIMVGIGLPGLAVACAALLMREPDRRRLRQDSKTGSFLVFMKVNWRLHFVLMLKGMLGVFAAYAGGAWYPSVLARVFDWSPQQIGAAIGTLVLFCGVAGNLCGGMLSSWCVSKGRDEAILLISAGAMLLQCASGASMFFVQDGYQFLVAAGIGLFVAPLMFTIGPTSLQLATPPHMRGRVMALALFIAIGIGAGGGPFAVGAANTLLWSEKQLEFSLGLILMVVSSMGAILSLMCVRPMRSYLDNSQSA